MYKVIWLVKFRKDLDPNDVRGWWREHHSKVAAATPGMVRYVQNHWMQPLDPETFLPRTGEMAFDGHAEHWFDSCESYEAAMASEQWQLTQEDGPTGFDASTLVGGRLEEHVISWEPMRDGRLYPREESPKAR